MFASYVTPSGIPPPAPLVRIARTIYPHWKQLFHQLIITPQCDENDFLNESYICFRRRATNPSAKRNVSHVLDIADALLARENVKQAVAVKSHNVWRARQSMADLLRKFPSLITKADEDIPSDPGPPATASAGQAVLPSERCAAIQPEIMMQKESEEIKRDSEVDVVDDPYQQFLIPPTERMWVDVCAT
ncbi:hypothetical protein B0H13DRAFT_2318886 [Mycena leptocephala]|nr:hypothetical protein B0H13DRAFT_2318886 [Mycena leptocephala]